MNAAKVHEQKIKSIKEQVADYPVPLAMTECHFSLPGRNRCEVLSTWAAGVANARMLNVNERHGDKLKIATLADFCGTRWNVNAVMIPVPRGKSFMMPVGLVMSLYRRHTGGKAVDISSAPAELDVTASRTGNRIYLHVINTNRERSASANLKVEGMKIISGKIFELAADPEFEVIQTQSDEIVPKEKILPESCRWIFPPASVSAVELDIQKA
ncbi:MAG: alpha-L-arabinofuranosidase C-terminal domain-containing protein [Planctomycetota bacterium]|jgi:alpha-L-arabinofuranosidase